MKVHHNNSEVILYLDSCFFLNTSPKERKKILKDLKDILRETGYSVKVITSSKTLDEIIRNIGDKISRKKFISNNRYYDSKFLSEFDLNYFILDTRKYGNFYILSCIIGAGRKIKHVCYKVPEDSKFEYAIGLDEYVDPSDRQHLTNLYYFSKIIKKRRRKEAIPILLSYDRKMVRDNPKIFKYVIVVSPNDLLEYLKNGKNLEDVKKDLMLKSYARAFNRFYKKLKNEYKHNL